MWGEDISGGLGEPLGQRLGHQIAQQNSSIHATRGSNPIDLGKEVTRNRHPNRDPAVKAPKHTASTGHRSASGVESALRTRATTAAPRVAKPAAHTNPPAVGEPSRVAAPGGRATGTRIGTRTGALPVLPGAVIDEAMNPLLIGGPKSPDS